MKRKKKYTKDELSVMVKWGERADKATQIIPPLATFVLLLHDMLLCVGIRLPYAEGMVVFLAVMLMLMFSYALGYCPLHRAFILYNWAMLSCIHFERNVGFDTLLQPMHYLMFVIGITLLCLLIKKNLYNKNAQRDNIKDDNGIFDRKGYHKSCCR